MNINKEEFLEICGTSADPAQRRKAAQALYLAGWVEGRQSADTEAQAAALLRTAQTGKPRLVVAAGVTLPDGPLPPGPLGPYSEYDPHN